MIQENLICTSCGAEMSSDARFCRRCGQASTRLTQESVTEGTTRILETPERKSNPFGPTSYEQYEQPGSLAQATSRISPQANPTARSLELEKKRPNWLLIGSMTVAVLALITVVILLATRNTTPTMSAPAGVAGPGIPSPPGAPPIPVQIGGSAIDPALIYPGAKTVMTIIGRGNGKGSVLQLQTTDSFEKVVDWYTEKLNPDSTVRGGEAGEQNVILASKDKQLSAIINKEGSDKVAIMLAQGKDKD